MHRSGTSLSASLLEKSGLNIGDDLMSNGFDNKKGHFEDWEILDIHEKDLKLKSLDPRALSGNIRPPLCFEKESINRIEAFLEKKHKFDLWGWKEPRTTLYLEAWKQIVPNTKCIAVFRHYDEVADSLIRRYNYKLKKGVAMDLKTRIKHFLAYPLHILLLKYNAYKFWDIYNTNILNFKNQYPDDVVIVELNHFIQNYNIITGVLNERFNIKLSKIEVDDILDSSLLSKKGHLNLKLRFFNVKKLKQTFNALKLKATWI